LKEQDGAAFESEEAIKKREAAAEQRRKESRNMVGETIKRGLEESEFDLRFCIFISLIYIISEEVQEPGKEIDDTDNKDPEEEFQAWRMRELMRLKREKEAERQREEERLEIERRRAMPEEQRLKEDLERAEKLREEKSKGGGAFLQKYWHKGAFYQVQLFGSRSFTTANEGSRTPRC
jgi:microfibrillar-associated protein 1